ncbi:MAG: DUF5602 domain-containing protein [Gemmatimonadaceae bacterium]
MTTRRSTSIRAAVVVTAVLTASIAAVTACSDNAAPVAAPKAQYGAPVVFGQGSARTFVTLDNTGAPASVGLTLSESALANLPVTPMPGMPSALMVNLPMPAAAQATGIDHATVDWNPQGHDPVKVYGVPHFDFHFYMISPSAQAAISPADPQFNQKLANQPGAQFRPTDYIQSPGGVPMMGAHWVDPTGPEFNGQPFQSSFIYGSYDGQFIFIESMIAKSYLESHPNVSAQVKQASAVNIPGYYPATSTIAYDAAAKEYRITFADLRRRP